MKGDEYYMTIYTTKDGGGSPLIFATKDQADEYALSEITKLWNLYSGWGYELSQIQFKITKNRNSQTQYKYFFTYPFDFNTTGYAIRSKSYTEQEI